MEPRFTVVQTQFESLLEHYEQTHENEILERQLISDEAFRLVAKLDLLIAEHLEELKKAGKLESLGNHAVRAP